MNKKKSPRPPLQSLGFQIKTTADGKNIEQILQNDIVLDKNVASDPEVDRIVNTLQADLVRAASLDIVGSTAAVMNGERSVCR
jgi:hypothetical protein